MAAVVFEIVVLKEIDATVQASGSTVELETVIELELVTSVTTVICKS